MTITVNSLAASGGSFAKGTCAQDIIVGALRRINAYAPGDVLASADATDAMQMLNDLLDSWSNEHLACFYNVETITYLQSGVNQYTVGNPVGGSFVSSSVNGATTLPGICPVSAIGGDISGPGVQSGTTIVTTDATSLVTLSQPLAASFLNSVYTYTTPGQWKIQRPLKINQAFSRLYYNGTTPGGLDYDCEQRSASEWAAIGLKGIPGPWPRVFYYDASFPLANMYIYPVPQSTVEFHMFVDNVLSDFVNLTDTVNLPPGYVRALKLNLAMELAPEYGKKPDQQLISSALQAKANIKNNNMRPIGVATIDAPSARAADAGWILHGGFSSK